MKVLLALCVFALASGALASSGGGARYRLDGSIAAGASNFNALSPSNVKLGTGSYFSLQAEKPFGALPLYLEVGLDYLKTTGTLNYDYTGIVHYSINNVSTTLDLFQANLGVRLKLLDNLPFRPYIEGGGLAGYLQMTYDDTLKNAANSIGSDYKTLDSNLGFGTYAEGGVELDVTQNVGVRASYRYAENTTRAMDTLAKQPLKYIVNIVYGSLYTHF